MDLGTMGIPREIAQLADRSNFLFSSNNPKGPGDYSPETSQVKTTVPAISFGKPPGVQKTSIAMWEEKMEKYIGVKPSDRKNMPKKEREIGLLSFEQQMREKPSFMF